MDTVVVCTDGASHRLQSSVVCVSESPLLYTPGNSGWAMCCADHCTPVPHTVPLTLLLSSHSGHELNDRRGGHECDAMNGKWELSR